MTKTLLIRFLFIHVLYKILDLPSFELRYIGDSGEQEVYDVFGRYGISSMPFQFSLYVASFVFISIAFQRRWNMKFIL